MAARSGQRGYLERKNGYWRVRFRIDVLGQEKREQRAVRICPVAGEGALPKAERLRKALEIIAQEGANGKDRFRQVEAETCPITFREQSEVWLASVTSRKRKPVKSHTLRSWQSHLAWLNPRIGNAPLAGINNLALRSLSSEMSEAGFKPKSCSTISGL